VYGDATFIVVVGWSEKGLYWGGSTNGLLIGSYALPWPGNSSLRVQGHATIDGTVTYGALAQGSDRRIKTNIATLTADSGLVAINQLRPVRYTRIDQPASMGNQVGFIAQEVQQVIARACLDLFTNQAHSRRHT
jgi:hypothetical protein